MFGSFLGVTSVVSADGFWRDVMKPNHGNNIMEIKAAQQYTGLIN